MPRNLSDSVVVITGASSGIGRATARAFALAGSSVVLAARREDVLAEAAQECERAGARAIAVPTDVTDPTAVEALAARAIDRFGRIDVWVNNAAVTLFGRFDESPPEQWNRVVETNLFGYVHGARAVLPHFRKRRAGVLINNASVMAAFGAPYLSAYVASKFAIRGLSESLRQELRGEGVAVCTLMPGSIDTPFFQHAANHTGRAIKPIQPIIAPERVAKTIVSLARRPRREAVVGLAVRQMLLQHLLTPGLAERLIARQIEHDHFKDEPAPPTPGNVLAPTPLGDEARGGWKNGGFPVGPAAAVAGSAAAAGAALLAREDVRKRLAGLVG